MKNKIIPLNEKIKQIEDNFRILDVEDVKETLKNLKEELKGESKHIKICDKLKIKGKEIIFLEDLCSRKDVEIFLSKIDKIFQEEIGEFK